jgi:hypothetical protein
VTLRPVVAAVHAAVLGVLVAGCSDFETVGILAGDAGSAVDGGARPPDGASHVPVTIDGCQADNAADLGTGAIAALLSAEGGSSDGGALRFLYPYDGTVFPGGLTAPLVMWDSPAITDDAVYVHLYSRAFDYRGCLRPTGTHQLQFPQDAWQLAGSGAGGAADPFTLELTTLAGGQVIGPISEHLILATGTLPGSIYYMTIGSNLGSNDSGVAPVTTGAIVRVRAQQPPELFLGSAGCTGCHSLSAEGTSLIAYAQGMGASYALGPGAAPDPPALVTPTPGGEYAGIYPDGTLYVTTGHPSGAGPRTYGADTLTAGLYETMTGNAIANSGIPVGAMLPSFSPDGSLLVFNDYAIDSGHGLALMDFSADYQSATSYRELLDDPMNYPGWPTFLPDGRGIVFSLGTGSEFSGGGTGVSDILLAGPPTDLYLVDATSHAQTVLAEAMGFSNAESATSNTTYLPFGSGDLHQNYDPTVLSVPSGGYAWVFFDSRRNYGNAGLVRQIWGAAIDVSSDGQYSADPSHPAFYLPGQEPQTGNFRPVAALDP